MHKRFIAAIAFGCTLAAGCNIRQISPTTAPPPRETASTPSAPASATPASAAALPQTQANALANPQFSDPWTKRQDICGSGMTLEDVQVPLGWEPYWICRRPADPPAKNRAPEFGPAGMDAPGRVRSGPTALRAAHIGSVNESAGIFQTVRGVAPGSRLKFSMFVQNWSSNCDTTPPSSACEPGGLRTRLCIDQAGVSGAPNLQRASVVCSPFSSAYDAYAPLSVEGVAQSDQVSVILDTTADKPVKHNLTFADDAELIVLDARSAATATATRPAAEAGHRTWIDSNGNGRFEPNEPPLGGVQVVLNANRADGQFTPVMTTTSDAAGMYRFSAVPPGLYFVRFERPNGFQFTAFKVAGAAEDTDSDADLRTGESTLFEVKAGGAMPSIDAGYVPLDAPAPYPPPSPYPPPADTATATASATHTATPTSAPTPETPTATSTSAPPPATPTATSTSAPPSATPTATSMPEDLSPLATVKNTLRRAVIRTLPRSTGRAITTVAANTRLQVRGLNQDRTFWRVLIPGRARQLGWVAANDVTPSASAIVLTAGDSPNGTALASPVSMRDRPALSRPVTTSVPRGTPLRVLGKSRDGNWWLVQVYGNIEQTGWVPAYDIIANAEADSTFVLR